MLCVICFCSILFNDELNREEIETLQQDQHAPKKVPETWTCSVSSKLPTVEWRLLFYVFMLDLDAVQ